MVCTAHRLQCITLHFPNHKFSVPPIDFNVKHRTFQIINFLYTPYRMFKRTCSIGGGTLLFLVSLGGGGGGNVLCYLGSGF